MRVKFPIDGDAKFSLFTNESDGAKQGSIYDFLKLVAKATNFGMYSAFIPIEENLSSSPTRSPTVSSTTSESQMFQNNTATLDTYDEVSIDINSNFAYKLIPLTVEMFIIKSVQPVCFSLHIKTLCFSY